MKRTLSSLILLFSILLSAAQAPSAADFLNVMRTPHGETWGMMDGEVTHRRRNSKPVKAPICFRVLFTNSRTIAKIIFRDNEICTVTQNIRPPYLYSADMQGGKSTLPDVGLTPGDLAMNFLFRAMIRENPGERVKGISCRVFDMAGNDPSETVRLYASEKDYFPLKVEWYRKEDAGKKPFRSMEVTEFQKVGGLWMVTEFILSGPGWRTVVSFDSKTLKAGLIRDGVPQDLFRDTVK